MTAEPRKQVGQTCPTSAAGTGGTTGTETRNPTLLEPGSEGVGRVGQVGFPLKGETPRLSRPGVPPLSPAQVEAAKVWASVFEQLRNPTAPVKRRMWASDIKRLGERNLSAEQRAILDMVAGRGLDLVTLSGRVGRTVEVLAELLTAALNVLAHSLEAQAAADDAA